MGTQLTMPEVVLAAEEVPPTTRSPETLKAKPRKPRGFAAMDPERRRAISSAGGRAAHAYGTAHKWTSTTASEAGRKGGLAKHVQRGKARA